MKAILGLMCLTLIPIFPVIGQDSKGAPAGLDTALIEQLTGAKGKLDEKDVVFKVLVPRSDLKVTAAGVHLTPPMGLTSWAAFKGHGKGTMVMGDMVLAEDQVNPVMSVALDNGLEVTALHNHFFWDTPKLMFMHIGGIGPTEKLASVVGKVFTKIRETAGGKGSKPEAEIDPASTTLDPGRIEGILGAKGELKDGVYKVVIGRTARMHSMEIGNTMGVNTWAAFAGTDERAVVDGDFAMLEPNFKARRSVGRLGEGSRDGCPDPAAPASGRPGLDRNERAGEGPRP